MQEQEIIDFIITHYSRLKALLEPVREQKMLLCKQHFKDRTLALFLGEIRRQYARRARQTIVEEVTKSLPVSALDAILVVEDLDLSLFS